MTTKATSIKLNKILNIKASICLGKVVGEYTYKGVIHDVKNPLVAYEGRFTADDLAPVLPKNIKEFFMIICHSNSGWIVGYEDLMFKFYQSTSHKDLAEAMGLMILWLAEQGLISKKFLK